MNDITMPQAPRRRGRPPSSNGEGSSDIQSLDRAISILEVLAGIDFTSLAEISRRTGLPISTVHRQLQTLEHRGLVGHDIETGLWSVGVGLFRIGSAYLRIRKLPEIARPVLRTLQQATAETINLSKFEDPVIVCVGQAESHASVRAFFRPGSELPLHASAAGKAVLSMLTPERREKLLEGYNYTRFTASTHSDKAALLADVELTAQRGYAVDNEEHSFGMRCVGAAILNEFGEPAGTISVSAPNFRMTDDRIAPFGDAMMEAAKQLTLLYAGRTA
ncbi:MAG: IclR family transcriptional regulator [Rhodospirillales bacterium]|nr:IclR family transcriptional regulator [Rhodospirillales bacterium]